MDTKVKVALAIAGLSFGICTATYIQQRYYWKLMNEAAKRMSDIVDTNNKIVTDLTFAGLMKAQPKEETDGDSIAGEA